MQRDVYTINAYIFFSRFLFPQTEECLKLFIFLYSCAWWVKYEGKSGVRVECGKIITISHFIGDGFYKWEICGCPEGHAHKHVKVVPAIPSPPRKKTASALSFFIPSFPGETFQDRN